MRRTRSTVHLDPRILRVVDDIAARDHRSRSSVVELLVAEAVAARDGKMTANTAPTEPARLAS